MASSFVQAAVSAGQVTDSPTVTITGVSAGAVLCVQVTAANANRGMTGIAAPGISAWNAIEAAQINSDDIDSMCGTVYAYNVPAGDYTITLTMSGSATYAVSVLELAGLTTSDPGDQGAAAAAIAHTLDVGPTAALTQAGEMGVLVGYGKLADRPFGDPAGWDRRVDEDGANTYHTVWTRHLSSTDAVTATLDCEPNNQFLLGVVETFLDATGGGGFTPRQRRTSSALGTRVGSRQAMY